MLLNIRSRHFDQPRLRRRVIPLLAGFSVLGGGVLSCSGDTTTGLPSHSATQAYWALQLTQHAVNLALTAPYDTVQLAATALTAAGTPLAGVDSVVHYSVLDSSVAVSPTGLVAAKYVTAQTQIIASLTTQGVTLTDTVDIQVTPTPPAAALKSFSLQPAAGDSAKRPVKGSYSWPVTATDVAGDTVCNATTCALQVYYTSSNPNIATIDRSTGQVSLLDTGHVVFTASTYAYGVTMRDSVAFTSGYMIAYTIDLTLAILLGVLTLGFAAPKKLILGVGAVVTFCNKSPQPVDVVFDHPEAVDTASCTLGMTSPPTGSGSIKVFGGDTTEEHKGTPYSNPDDCRARRFPVPDTIHYHSSLFPSDTFEFDIQVQK